MFNKYPAVSLILGCSVAAMSACSGSTQPKDVRPATQTPSKNATPAPQTDRIEAGKLREEAIAMIETLFRTSRFDQIRAHAVEAAGTSPKRLREIIELGITDPSPGVRSVAAGVVGKYTLREFAPALRPLLKDASQHVRASTIYALTRTGDNPDQTPLGQMLLTESDPWVNRHAASMIGEVRNKTALPLLQNALTQRVPNMPPAHQRIMQLLVAESMVKLGDDSQRPVLRAALFPSQPEDLESAAIAAQILGEINDRESAGQMLNVASYKDKSGKLYPAEVRLAIAGSLAKMGQPAAAGIADEYLQGTTVHQAQAATVYGEVGGTTHWGKLAMLMEHPNELVRISAASAILKSSAK
jgi:HEAT repeat protein